MSSASTVSTEKRLRRSLVSGAAALWVAAVVLGAIWLTSYGSKPGPAAQAPARWPDPPGIELATSKPTLVAFAHPRCPCTRATVAELHKIAAKCRGELAIQIAFCVPPPFDEPWARTDLWRDAESIPGAEVRADRGGELARSFGASTSGQVLVYAANGELLFSGGVTAARGHAGDNAGEDSVVAIVRTGVAPLASTQVFGCPLL